MKGVSGLFYCRRCFCTAPRSEAQQTAASIRGRVVDASGGIVRDASVMANSLVNFLFVGLPLGNYRLEANAKSFQKFVQEGITMRVNQTGSVRVQLAVGTTTQTIEVNANASMNEPATTKSGDYNWRASLFAGTCRGLYLNGIQLRGNTRHHAQNAKEFERFWGGRRGLNPRHSVPQTDALPAELLPPLLASLA
jgi:hypothetical protein